MPLINQGLSSPYAFPGWTVDRVELEAGECRVWLERDAGAKIGCPTCGMQMRKRRESERTVSDVPMGICSRVTIHYRAIQGCCRACHRYSTIHPEHITNFDQTTWRFRLYVSRLAWWLPISDVGDLLAIHKTTALRYNWSVIERTADLPSYDGLRVLLVDELPVRKGQYFVTVILNGETGELIHVHEGKNDESLLAFFEKLRPAQKSTIMAIGIDRSRPYRQAIERHLPDASIVHDKFYLISNLAAVAQEARSESLDRTNAINEHSCKASAPLPSAPENARRLTTTNRFTLTSGPILPFPSEMILCSYGMPDT